MAEDDGGEKTHEPTSERLREAQEKGDFAFSKEVVTLVTFAGMMLWFVFAHVQMQLLVQECMRDYFSFGRFIDMSPQKFGMVMWSCLGYLVKIVGPILGVALVLSYVASVCQIGFKFASKKEFITFKKLNPVAGMKNLVSPDKLFEGLKSILKSLLFAGVCFQTVLGEMGHILTFGSMAPGMALEATFWVVIRIIFRAVLLFILFAIVDYAFQRFRYLKKLRMSNQEVKDEHKRTEGDPRNKQRQRTKQIEMSRNRMIISVRDSDVVVTNPTHYAVALRYDSEKETAPRLVAKGARLVAERIKKEARDFNVPVVEDRYIARSIYFGVQIGQEVPPTLFRAVAEILAYVYRLAGRNPRSAGRRAQADPMAALKVDASAP